MDRRKFINNIGIITAGSMLLPALETFAAKNTRYNYHNKVKRVPFHDITVPLLGLGCLRIEKDDYKSRTFDIDYFQKMVDYAIKHGVNYFDTAYSYKGNEGALGEVLKNYKRNEYILADKLPIHHIFTLEDAKRCFESSLKRLNTDYFDFYMYHSVDQYSYPNYKNNDIYKMLEDYKRQGVIKYLGFSSHCTPELLAQLVKEHLQKPIANYALSFQS